MAEPSFSINKDADLFLNRWKSHLHGFPNFRESLEANMNEDFDPFGASGENEFLDESLNVSLTAPPENS